MAFKNLIVIAGPTAVGKTALSIQLAKQYNCPILSADSRQFFKEMSIGTAKPTVDEMEGVKHYFINNKSINEPYNVGDYEKEAIVLIEELFTTHTHLILIGGSGLYINAILNGVDDFEEVPKEIRENLIHQYNEKGITYLQKELEKLDPIYYINVDVNNPQRMMRALEICLHTNKPFSEQRTQQKKQREFNAIPILINTDREILYERINKRVDEMMQNGLLQEVENLVSQKDLNALKTVGYKELFSYLEGFVNLQEAVSLIKQNTRRYAKRQLTWFNNQGDFETFKPDELEKIKSYIDIIVLNS